MSNDITHINMCMDDINELLELAQEYGLITEVIYSALEAMKENPNLEPVQAIEIGLEEWDCYK
jgi:hypothetical protein